MTEEQYLLRDEKRERTEQFIISKLKEKDSIIQEMTNYKEKMTEQFMIGFINGIEVKENINLINRYNDIIKKVRSDSNE